MNNFDQVIKSIKHDQATYLKDSEPWKEYESAISVLQQECCQADVINAFEKFLANYNLLDLYVTYNPSGKEYNLAEAAEEMRNRTDVGKEFIQKIYYNTILSLVEGEDVT